MRHAPADRLVSVASCSLLVLGFCVLLTAGCDDGGGGGGDDTSGGNDVLDAVDTSGDGVGDDGDASDGDTVVETCSDALPCADPGAVCDPATSRCVARCTATSCASGAVCDLASGLCVAGDACATSAECTGTDEVCNGCRGVCEAIPGAKVCVDDTNCFTDQYCEPCTGTCREKAALCEACVFDRECGASEDRCVDLIASGGRFCLQACSDTPDCPPGYSCADISDGVRQCVPASGDCAAPAACEGTDDTQCPGQNEICRDGRCVPGCTMGGCPSMQVCEAGRCKAPCDARPEGCVAPAMCDAASGLCKIDGECISSRDCPPQNYCDVAQQQCVPGCQVDNDCGTFALECVDGSCETRGCEGAYACGFEQVCDLGTGMCAAAEGPYCEMCDPQDTMACGGEPNKCLGLQDAQGNAVGDFCFVACSEDPANVCPQGYQCTELQDSNGNPAGSVCFRDCTTDPFG